MESIFKLGILLSVVDAVSGPVGRMTQGMDALKNKAASVGPHFAKFKTYGLWVATAAAMMLHVLAGTVTATEASQKALGELASVGVQDLGALERAGAQFSNQWSGTTKAQFISAAYDIKSGISSLTDEGVAEFTRFSALTGKATKSTTAEMTSLFATGYGIYKDMYGDLSDFQFGELFSGGIAASVQAFKTTGSGMAQAISTLGATATTAKAPLEEQLAILGMLQATMTGSEAGTKYKALMQTAAGAGKDLKISFMDSNNQLLSMPGILTKLRGKYGETLDAMEKMEIKKAFGSDEAVAVIDLLYNKVGALTDSTRGLSSAMRQGTGFTKQMALAMNQGIWDQKTLMFQQTHNAIEQIGKKGHKIMGPLYGWIGNAALAVQSFADKHEKLTGGIVISLWAFAALAFVAGGVLAVLGTIGLLAPGVAVGIAALKGAFLALASAAKAFLAALLVHPVTAVIVAVIGLGAVLYALYNRFESVRNVVDPFLAKLKVAWEFIQFFAGWLLGALLAIPRTLSGASQAIVGFFDRPGEAIRGLIYWIDSANAKIYEWAMGTVAGLFDPIKASANDALEWIRGLVPRFLEAGSSLLDAIANGIKAKVRGPYDAVRSAFGSLANLLSNSDAKEGPLSHLTASGRAIMDTLSLGIRQAAPALKTVTSAALAGIMATAITLPTIQTAAMPAPAIQPPAITDLTARAMWETGEISVPAIPDLSAAVDMRTSETRGQKSEARGQRSGGRGVQIGTLNITLPGVSDAQGFIEQLKRLVEGYDA